MRQIEQAVTGIGTLRAVRVVKLTPASAGRVSEIMVRSGAEVSEGDVLIQLDDRAEKAALADAEATLREAVQDFRRFEELGDSRAASEARVEKARAAFRRAEAAVSSAEAALEDRKLMAPFAGTLGLLDVEPGSFLSPDTSVATLFDLKEVELRLSLPERYYDRVSSGQEVSMTTPAYPDVTFEGRVDVRASEINLATRSFEVRARINNADRRLVGGMFANARIVIDTYDALSIPDDAIISEGLSTYVYTVADNTATRTEVATGNSIGAKTEVRSGLDPDDRVVVAGWDNLSDGAAVQIDSDFEQEALN